MLQEAEIVELRLKFFSAGIFCFASWTTLIHRRLDSKAVLKKRPRFASFKTTELSEVMTSFFSHLLLFDERCCCQAKLTQPAANCFVQAVITPCSS